MTRTTQCLAAALTLGLVTASAAFAGPGTAPTPTPTFTPIVIPGGDRPTIRPCDKIICGIQVVYNDHLAWDQQSVSVTALCPKGTIAIGGGVKELGNPDRYYVSASHPAFDDDDPNGWEGTPIGWYAEGMRNPGDPPGAEMWIAAWAVCATMH